MSELEHSRSSYSHSQYTGQTADGHATQIVGNVGTIYIRSAEKSLTDCLAALFLTDALEDRKRLNDTKGRRVSGTCEWIKKNDTYLSWVCSRSELLWLSGGPGKGKTMLSIFLAEALEQIARESQEAIFIQYFCDNKDEKRNTAVAVLRGLIFQLLQKRENLGVHILPTFKIQKDSLFTNSSFGSLWTCFESMVRDSSLGVVYCVVDGLDECDEASLEVFLKRLRTLFSPRANLSPSCHLNLIVVSREQPDFVEKELSNFPRIRLGPHADSDLDDDLNSDISNFITSKVGELSRYSNYPPQLRAKVEDVFRERAEGTFLWVGIVARELEYCTCDEVELALDRFPPGLNELYDRMLSQIPPQRQETVAKILRWVVMAVRPLSVLELGTAIGNTAEASGLSCEEVTLAQVRKCGHLLTITDTSPRHEIGLLHQSVKDYLLRQHCDAIPQLEFFRIKKEAANLEIAKQCLDYLQGGIPMGGVVPVDGGHPFWKAFPLLSYAVFHWTEHARCLSNPELDIFDLSRPFYADQSPVRDAWVITYRAANEWQSLPDSSSLLEVASYFGIVVLVEKLLRRNGWKKYLRFAIKKKISKALCWAVRQGNEAVMRLLIEKGADIDVKDRWGDSILHAAVRGGNEAIVRLLIEKGADVDVKDDWGKSILHAAAFSGNQVIVRLLIEKGADLKVKNDKGESILYTATRRGNEAIARLLIEKGADLKAKNDCGESILYATAHGGNEAIMRLLIEKGADLKVKNDREESILHAAVWGGNEMIVRLLLQKGLVFETTSDEYKLTPFETAIKARSEAMVRLVIAEGGVDLTTENRDTKNAVRWAVHRGNEEILRLLIGKGVTRDENKTKTLVYARMLRSKEMVQLLEDFITS